MYESIPEDCRETTAFSKIENTMEALGMPDQGRAAASDDDVGDLSAHDDDQTSADGGLATVSREDSTGSVATGDGGEGPSVSSPGRLSRMFSRLKRDPSPGHVFVTKGDLRKLQNDLWLIPSNSAGE